MSKETFLKVQKNIKEYSGEKERRKMIEIYTADWTFYYIQNAQQKADKVAPREIISKDVVTKRIPIQFIIEEKLAYKRAISIFSDTELTFLETDKATGLKKFKIKYKTRLGEVNNHERNLEDLH